MTTPIIVQGWHPGIPVEYRDNIVTGDALECLRRLPDASIPLFLFSPPYNLGTSTGGGIQAYRSHYAADKPLGKRGGRGDRGKCRWAGGQLANGYDDYDDARPHEEYVAWQKEILAECWRCLTPDGAIFYQHKPRVLDGVLVDPLDYVPTNPTGAADGDKLHLRPYVRQRLIWLRAGGVNATPAFYMPMQEQIIIIARPGWRLRDQSASAVGDVWRIPQETGTWHPAPFPLALPLRVLETTAAPLVCDPFAGSGTTARAARLTGVRWIGFERNAAYAARANAEVAALSPLPLAWQYQQAELTEAV